MTKLLKVMEIEKSCKQDCSVSCVLIKCPDIGSNIYRGDLPAPWSLKQIEIKCKDCKWNKSTHTEGREHPQAHSELGMLQHFCHPFDLAHIVADEWWKTGFICR